MEVREIRSETVVAREPRNAEELYEQLSATALDFRALDVPQDWHEELRDLSTEVRKLMPETPPLAKAATNAMTTRASKIVQESGLMLRSERSLHAARLALRLRLRSIFQQLLRIRKTVWLDLRLENVAAERYCARLEVEAATLASRLTRVQSMMPTPEESAETALSYLDQHEFWGGLERPSRRRERKRALETLIATEQLQQRVKRYYQERHRVIFAWEEPETEWTRADELAARETIIKKLEDLGVGRSEVGAATRRPRAGSGETLA